MRIWGENYPGIDEPRRAWFLGQEMNDAFNATQSENHVVNIRVFHNVVGNRIVSGKRIIMLRISTEIAIIRLF